MTKTPKTSKVPDRAIRVSFYDTDGVRVDNVTKKQAKTVNSGLVSYYGTDKVFYFQDKNGILRQLNIEEVLKLTPQKDLISDSAFSSSLCPTEPQPCGPPKVQFFGGGGVGAMANAVISPISSSVIAFDIVNPGKNYKSPPIAILDDECGKGNGSSLKIRMRPSGKKDSISGEDLLEVDSIYIDAPGDGYLIDYDGSLGGGGRVWKESDEGYVKTKDGNYYTVPDDKQPTTLGPGDTWNPPYSAPVVVPDNYQPGDPLVPPTVVSIPDVFDLGVPGGVPGVPGSGVPGTPLTPSLSTPTIPTYRVIICLDDVVIDDPGFNYKPGDTIKITPDNGSVLEPIINKRGEIVKVNILSKGCGFTDLPEIIVQSPTGFNAVIKPILSVTRVLDEQQILEVPPGIELISVVDCVGKIAPKDVFDIVPR